ncbi:Endonuclease/exonuclease/phosphatase [Coprinopsis sp. MPI-PUGE-AT-0042]|nr:Endonuclease/exonuclease/phosphatase [Coprinopsis sp. MPI-PUGE-AT-0042]
MSTNSSARSRKTPEEIAALQEARKAKKLETANQTQSESFVGARLLERPWLSVESSINIQPTMELRIATWNLLAQILVRRELFPTSDCLKAGQREPLIHEEIARLDADVFCMQEVDRLERLGPMLEKAGYSFRFATGPKKRHGCLIAYKASLFELEGERIVFYDDEEVRLEGTEEQKKGKSFVTKNIALIVSLRRIDGLLGGLVVGTTHLFWHPRYTYERVRQAGILTREATIFQDSDPTRQAWPCILAGDFNFPPEDPGYALLTGAALLPEQIERLVPSYVVHKTVDPNQTQETSTGPSADAEEGGEDADPDRVITNARRAEPSDGLLRIDELGDFFPERQQVQSIYQVGLKQYLSSTASGTSLPPIYGSNRPMESNTAGYYEPKWTSYTHYWKSVLDYIFITNAPTGFQVSGLLAPLDEEVLEPGLPQRGVCGSDHLPLMAQVKFGD